MPDATELVDRRILITGLTGQVGRPVAVALARQNTVIGVARFGDEAIRSELEAAGVECVVADLGTGDLNTVPSDVDHVLNFAVAKVGRWDDDLAANVEGLGFLLQHCGSARSFLHCSSTAVYAPKGHEPIAETDPLGDNHRVMMPTYSINKIAAESMARFCARSLGVPTTIARLNVPYGDGGGWPWLHLEQVLAGQAIWVHADAPSVYNPIHEDDIVASVPALLAAGSVPATTVNWGGLDAVSIEEWAAYLGELVGKPATFEFTPHTLESVRIDTTRMETIIPTPTVPWKDGFRRMVAHFHPEVPLPR